MTIEVTGCHDCPFAEMDDECGIDYWCFHPLSKILAMNVNTNVDSETPHPSCPLKQETITIKLKENDNSASDN